jgi:hypothetical protein
MISERIQDESIHCIPFIAYASLHVSFGCPQVLRHPPCRTILIEMGLISEFLWNSIIKVIKIFNYFKLIFGDEMNLKFNPLVPKLQSKKLTICLVEGFPTPNSLAPVIKSIIDNLPVGY